MPSRPESFRAIPTGYACFLIANRATRDQHAPTDADLARPESALAHLVERRPPELVPIAQLLQGNRPIRSLPTNAIAKLPPVALGLLVSTIVYGIIAEVGWRELGLTP